MHALAGLFSSAAHLVSTSVAPTPSPSSTVDPDLVTPGPWGFVVFAFLGVVVILLVWDMLRRVRRARYREEVNAELDAEAEAAAQADRAVLETDADDESADAAGDDPAR